MMEMYRYHRDLGFALGGVYCDLDGYQFKRLLSTTHIPLVYHSDQATLIPLTRRMHVTRSACVTREPPRVPIHVRKRMAFSQRVDLKDVQF
jgi:hypothetical protein